MRDLRDLLSETARHAPVDVPATGGLVGRVRRRRAVRTGVRSAAGVGAVGAIAFAAVHVPSLQNQAADEAGIASDPAAEAGSCGGRLADLDATASTVDGPVRVAVVPAATSTVGIDSSTLDVAVVVGSSFEDPVVMSFGGASVVLTDDDGIVVATAEVDPGALAQVELGSQKPLYLWSGIGLESCSDQAPLDGDYEVWAVLQDGAGQIVGGGTPVRVADGQVPTVCGRDIDDVVTGVDHELAIEGEIQLGTVGEDTEFESGAGTDTLWLRTEVTARGDESDAGAMDGVRLLLTDESGTVVMDSATSPNAGRSAEWYDLPAVGLGGQLFADAVGCDGQPLPEGDYEAWALRMTSSWDAEEPGGRLVGANVGGFSFGSGSSDGSGSGEG
ncbi:hypothetical protein [Cellulomonas composti]|uniref:Uncharacterized protein n=1 Tax=Cellulomonas composti TaxID=266130 RepID=A0A511JCD5_9CELL|nr:hypothetical protein [Cellulomonas composti]GEL95646.1 hypothetical protein CCO02nite_23040 [Cellulomonas composti]